MRISEDGKSLDVTVEEVIKMSAEGFSVVINDGRVTGFEEETDGE